ncbi:MAG: RNA polymerase subunit sigma-70, partial [Lachnospiraceae bacterium]|nr:RNA polymerase subunit sigma-70 [Lachnospiraceae bacterium]
KLLSEEISRFLSGLSRNMRVVFVQRYFYFSSVHEISENLGLTENNVKSLLFRSRNKLREHLLKEGFVI